MKEDHMIGLYIQLSLFVLSFILFVMNISYPVELAIAIPVLIKMIKIARKIKAKNI